jgi:hypothetical protein
MRKELTMQEMTNYLISKSKQDPLTFHQYPNFSPCKTIEPSKTVAFLRKSFILPNPKHLPSSHYIEHRFQPYLRAKTFKKSLFKNLVPNNALTDRESTSTRFKTSRYPQVPLTKELIQKVESINTYRKCEKKTSAALTRPCSQLSCSRKGFDKLENCKSDKLIISLPTKKIWRKQSIFDRESEERPVKSEKIAGDEDEIFARHEEGLSKSSDNVKSDSRIIRELFTFKPLDPKASESALNPFRPR